MQQASPCPVEETKRKQIDTHHVVNYCCVLERKIKLVERWREGGRCSLKSEDQERPPGEGLEQRLFQLLLSDSVLRVLLAYSKTQARDVVSFWEEA